MAVVVGYRWAESPPAQSRQIIGVVDGRSWCQFGGHMHSLLNTYSLAM
jgi:hypothetical protein